MKLIYPAIFDKLEDREGYCVTFPDLPGCVTQGASLSEAIENAQDAACGWVLDELEDGNAAPKSSDIGSVKCENGCFVNLVMLDMDSYAEKYGEKAVRKNCTIPAWLNTAAEKNNINFSAVLQNALINELHLA
ncbi:MAG: type II toxin-antitoxin system HicB family antitoxin [Ruminococcus sp.]|nr:type II toxin-antitoxin system HicB family antitoxin [Ruminococcus sp.]